MEILFILDFMKALYNVITINWKILAHSILIFTDKICLFELILIMAYICAKLIRSPLIKEKQNWFESLIRLGNIYCYVSSKLRFQFI